MFEWLAAHALDIFNVASNVIAGSAIVAALTPNTTDNQIVATARKVLDFLACNWGRASNG